MHVATYPPVKDYKQLVINRPDTHSIVVGYVLWFFVGIIGGHRFYYGRPLTGILWFFTLGLLGVGWLIDLFLIPSMDAQADSEFNPGATDYSVAWALFWLFGLFGLHRFYQGKFATGILYILTFGIFGIGYLFDLLTLNEQISELNASRQMGGYFAFN
jgi:TM2 domain-containing membrane protein YozV